MACVPFSEVYRLLLEAFPNNKCSWVEVSRLLHFTFPSVEIRRDTKGKRETICVGIERCSEEGVAPPARYYEALLRHEQETNAILTARVQQLEQQLQMIGQSSRIDTQIYKDEFLHLVLDSSILGSGPNNLDNLDSFSVSAMASDIQAKAPHLYSLLWDLGDTNRNARGDTTTTQEEIKAIMSVCTLANSRSQRVKGMQLFLSLMLIARAVNKQVGYSHDVLKPINFTLIFI